MFYIKGEVFCMVPGMRQSLFQTLTEIKTSFFLPTRKKKKKKKKKKKNKKKKKTKKRKKKKKKR